MSEQNNNSTPEQICDLVISYLQNRKKYNVGDNFRKNLLEILSNPNSNYYDQTRLFSEIPELVNEKDKILKEKKDLEKEVEDLVIKLDGDENIRGLKDICEELENKHNSLVKSMNGDSESEDVEKQKGLKKTVDELKNSKFELEIKIDGDEESELDEEREGLKNIVSNLENKKTTLEKLIDGDKNSQDTLLRVGLQKRKDQLEKIINGDTTKSNDDEKIGLVGIRNRLNKEIEELTKQNDIVEDLAGFREEAIQNRNTYNGYVIRTIGVILLSSLFAYWYGNSIFKDLSKIQNLDDRDYFGVFMLKIPFSLMIITFISGGFVFISKLLVIIERINNQLRNISQISVIASQIDQKTIDLIRENGDEFDEIRENLHEAENNKKKKTLFYKLITKYLVNLSKNELELKEKKGLNLKNLKDLAEIVNKVNFNKNHV